MKRRFKLAASLLMILGLAFGVAISYSSQTSDLDNGTLDGCPVYSTQASLLNRVGTDLSANLGNRLGIPNGIPAGAGGGFIDQMAFQAMTDAGIQPAARCTDEEFLRRAYVDLTGQIPTSDKVRSFLANPDRAALVEELLASPEFTDRMVMYYGDLFQNTFPMNYGGRQLLNQYLRDSVTNDVPYNQLMTDLLTARGNSYADGPVNFLARQWEMMAVRYDVLDNITAEAGRTFLGVPVLCTSCHNGRNHLEQVNLYLSTRTRQQFWGLAAFMSELNYTRAAGPVAQTFQYNFTTTATTGYDTSLPGARNGVRPSRTPVAVYQPNYSAYFTSVAPQDPGPSSGWRSEFARILTADKQFARTVVNRWWEQLFGVGIVSVVDAFDLARLDPNNPPPEPWTIQPSNPALLEALAQDFIDNGFQMKDLIRKIMTSNLYQLSAAYPGEWQGSYAQYFARHFARRLPSESVLDGITQATGRQLVMTTRDGGQTVWAGQLEDPTEPQPNAGSNAAIRAFLNKFFRGSRNGAPRTSEGSIQQVLELVNNTPLVYNRVRPNGGLAQRVQSMSPEDAIDELFLSTVNRYPKPAEKSQVLQSYTTQGMGPATENLLWSLVSSLDFLHY